MTNNEFAKLTDGITAAKIAEITGKSVSTINSYSNGRLEIPFDVGFKISKLAQFIDGMKKNEESREMKKIINGKLYNTETATLIAEYSNGLGSRDFKNISEGLYRTKSGAFFLAGEGGAMTKYARKCDSSYVCGGEDIIPVNEFEVKEWLENYADPEIYIATFGEPPEA